MTFITTRTRFGRYVFAIGGNPEAAELAGINTRWVTMKVFMLMGVLAAIGAAISIGPPQRGDQRARHARRALVIAAAVIGGTSLAGGVGTIAGAMLGALLMQSLQSGMVLLGVDTPLQSIVVGARAGRRRLARHALPQARLRRGDHGMDETPARRWSR